MVGDEVALWVPNDKYPILPERSARVGIKETHTGGIAHTVYISPQSEIKTR